MLFRSVPGAARPIAKISDLARRHPWKVGWPLAGIKGGGWGTVF